VWKSEKIVSIAVLHRQLQGVSEPSQTLNDLSASISALVGPPELQVQHHGDDHDQSAGSDGCVHAWTVRWLVLRTENGATNDTTHSSHANKSRRAKSSLPLTTDVVCLPCQDARNVGVASSSSEENPKVANADGLGEAKESKTDQAHESIDQDEWRADVILVTEDCERVHDDGSEDVWRRNEALGIPCAEPHSFLENDWQKVCNSISASRGKPEERCETPDFEVEGVLEVCTDVERLRDGIMSVLLDASDNEFSFALVQELETERSGRQLREVDNGDVSTEAKDAGKKTLQDEDPSPASNAGFDVEWSWLRLGRVDVLSKVAIALASSGEL